MRGVADETVLVVGMLALTGIIVLSGFRSLSDVELPEKQDQVVEGSPSSVSSDLAALVDACWKKNAGSSTRRKSCFDLKVFSKSQVPAEDIESRLSQAPEDKVDLPGTVREGETTYLVQFNPSPKEVALRTLRKCEPSQGDYCETLSCSCRTSCVAGLDSDSDGTLDTGPKGCAETPVFEPDPEPPVGAESIQNGSLDNEVFSFSIGNRIAFHRVSVTDEEEVLYRKVVDADQKISATELVGAGGNERNLFTGDASVKIEEQNGQKLHIYGCDMDNSLPSNCRWLEPLALE